MRKATRISLALGTSAALLSLAALPASAVEGEPTSGTASAEATIEVPSGALSISITPEARTLVDFSIGDPNNEENRTASIAVPLFTVTDLRAVQGEWSVSVSLTDFTALGVSDPIKVGGSTYVPKLISDSGVVTTTVNSSDFAQGTGEAAGIATGSKNAIEATGVHGNNTASWEAEVKVPVPANVLSGDYKATLTHSML